jgi:hypothetical protein
MRTFAIAAMMIALLSVSADAQQRGPRTTRSDEDKRTDAEIDKAYQNAIKNTGDKGRPVAIQDPWGTVRPSGGSTDKR